MTLHSDVFVDPRDWQRYAHPFFLRGRMDVLDRIKRQAPSRLGCSGANRNTSNVLHAIKGYNKYQMIVLISSFVFSAAYMFRCLIILQIINIA